MSIIIKGDNNGIAVEGTLNIEHLDFEFGKGVTGVSGVSQDAEYTEVEEAPAAEQQQTKDYPEITDINRCLFVEKVKNDAKEKVDLPVDELLHTIYDLTTDWDPKLNSVHKWRVLYETLSRMGYLYLEQRPRYTSFVKAVVMYCFPDTEDKYGGNIKKTALDTEYTNWSYEDKALFQELKKALDIQTLTSPK